MNEKKPAIFVGATILVLAIVGFSLLAKLDFSFSPKKSAVQRGSRPAENNQRAARGDEKELPPTEGSGATPWLMQVAGMLFDLSAKLKGKSAIPNEAILTFPDDASYQKFLAEAEKSGLKVKDTLPLLRAVRLGFDNLEDLQRYLASNPDSNASMSANYFVDYPVPPEMADRSGSFNVPIGGSALPYIGLNGQQSLGEGLTVAILDSSVQSIPALNGRIKSMQLADPPTTDLSHGTSVASLVAGEGIGVLSKANILSIGVVAADGRSDAFTLADGVIAAVQNGAQIINISMGSDTGSEVLRNAIDYAIGEGAVVVASAGNDGYTNSTYPARFEGVVAATATDKYGQIASFSNGSQNYGFAAPGLEDYTYNANGELVSFSGTSASSPLVAGSIGAVMSQYPGVTAQEAVQMLQAYANEGGAPGVDADFGYGIINLDRVFNAGTTGRVDAAVASHYYSSAEGGSMSYVVENRGTTPMTNWTLDTVSDGVAQQWALPTIQPNAETVIKLPVDANRVQAGQVEFQSRLTAPNGVRDTQPSNNGRASVVQAVSTSPTTK